MEKSTFTAIGVFLHECQKKVLPLLKDKVQLKLEQEYPTGSKKKPFTLRMGSLAESQGLDIVQDPSLRVFKGTG